MDKVTEWCIRNIWGRDNFGWRYIPSQGRSGGLILIWDDITLNVEDELIGEHSISIKFSNRFDNFNWVFTNGYSPNEVTGRLNFWKELDKVKAWWQGAWCIAADFNAIRDETERNKPGGNKRNRKMLNAFLNRNALLDLPLAGGNFTWSDMKEDPLLCRLDRFLISTEWETKYPRVTQMLRTRTISDHNPILLNANGISRGKCLNWPTLLNIMIEGKKVKENYVLKISVAE
ncbi:Endonuclease/exonuclease/phosphatase [Macleaya cordata]|uniref:Endonuclease/exonuclease/phosphatase n=1 Tax=Macleaya cordata TaxID=56857 RepID=A0A200QJF0_MACCD|nr:Endonuclease/exonuclease/phosphatase [Macleaya cordata]